MRFRHLTLLAIAVLVLVLGAGFLAHQRWVVRDLRYEAAEAERKRQVDALLLFGSSLTAVALDVPRTVRGTVYVPAYASIRAGDGRSRIDLATTLSIHNTSPGQAADPRAGRLSQHRGQTGSSLLRLDPWPSNRLAPSRCSYRVTTCAGARARTLWSSGLPREPRPNQ